MDLGAWLIQPEGLPVVPEFAGDFTLLAAFLTIPLMRGLFAHVILVPPIDRDNIRFCHVFGEQQDYWLWAVLWSAGIHRLELLWG